MQAFGSGYALWWVRVRFLARAMYMRPYATSFCSCSMISVPAVEAVQQDSRAAIAVEPYDCVKAFWFYITTEQPYTS